LSNDIRLLDDDQVRRYESDGYLVVHDLLTDAEVRAFLDHESKPKPSEWHLGLRTHTADPQWRYLATHPRVAGIARQLLNSQPMIVQTMFLNKPANGGTGIALHQDTHYLPSEPNTLMACWLAFTDTDGNNGGLCVVPGSHHEGLRSTHKARDPREHAVWETEHRMRDRRGKEWTQRLVSFEIDDLDPASIAKLTVPRGGGVFFTGMTIHGSFANRSTDRPRPAFAVHYIAAESWLLRTDVQEVVPALPA